MIVIGSNESLDSNEPIGTGAVFDNDRLAPARRQPIGQQPGTDIDPRPRTEGNDEFDRPLRPRLRAVSSL